jgi:hypothetical protein
MKSWDRFIEKQCNLPHMCRIPLSVALVILICAGVMLAGCTWSGLDRSPAGTAPPARESPPGVTIISPASGAVLPAGDITISVKVTNFTLVPEYGQPFAPGAGHLHYYMGVGVPAPGAASSAVAPITYAATTGTSYTWPDIPPGAYTFTVELANNDHSPFTRPVSSSVAVRVTG